jgi:hypothetical protein
MSHGFRPAGPRNGTARFTEADARRVAEAIGLLGPDGPCTAAILVTPGAARFELCMRHDDDVLEHLPALCDIHRGPLVVISSRAAGARVEADDWALFDAAADLAAAAGAMLVDWLVVDDEGVRSLGWDGGFGWVVREAV